MQAQLIAVRNILISLSDLFAPLILILVWVFLDFMLKKMFRKGFSVTVSRLQSTILSNNEARRQSIEYRFKTIRQLSTQFARVVLALFMGFWTLSSINIDVRPVIAGIGVAGLGLSLAAQNIIRDYLNGFIILLEDQYNVGDVIEINKYSGAVETFTLRATRIRDLEGNLLTIPNGVVQTVINYTKDWSVALVNVGITYETDYKKARIIMEELAEEIVKIHESMIIEPPRIQGITDFGENSVNLRTLIKTIPGQQWEIARIWREMLKERFDAEGIQFACPKVVVSMQKDAK